MLLSVAISAVISAAFFLRAVFTSPMDENSAEQSIKSSVKGKPNFWFPCELDNLALAKALDRKEQTHV